MLFEHQGISRTLRSIGFGALAASAVWLTSGLSLAEPAPAARSFMLIGYGLVLGLDDTGDSLQTSPLTTQSLKALLARQHAQSEDLSVFDHRVAAVIVTASFRLEPTDAAPVDLRVSSMVDATSLEGGRLARTSLMGPDGKIYVVGEGVLAPCQDAPVYGAFDARLSGCIVGGGVKTPP
jgi:flagellar P-ring protein FlgI